MHTRTWQEIPEERLNDRITRRMFHTETMTVARIGLQKGAVVPLHSHPNEQITTVTSGRLRVEVSGEVMEIGAGEMFLFPANIPHRLEALEDSIATDVFSPPREDWIRGDDAYLRK